MQRQGYASPLKDLQNRSLNINESGDNILSDFPTLVHQETINLIYLPKNISLKYISKEIFPFQAY